MDTLGSLCDKLCTVNIKLWFEVERSHKVDDLTFEERGDVLNKLTSLNKERNVLKREIDEICQPQKSS